MKNSSLLKASFVCASVMLATSALSSSFAAEPVIEVRSLSEKKPQPSIEINFDVLDNLQGGAKPAPRSNAVADVEVQDDAAQAEKVTKAAEKARKFEEYVQQRVAQERAAKAADEGTSLPDALPGSVVAGEPDALKYEDLPEFPSEQVKPSMKSSYWDADMSQFNEQWEKERAMGAVDLRDVLRKEEEKATSGEVQKSKAKKSSRKKPASKDPSLSKVKKKKKKSAPKPKVVETPAVVEEPKQADMFPAETAPVEPAAPVAPAENVAPEPAPVAIEPPKESVTVIEQPAAADATKNPEGTNPLAAPEEIRTPDASATDAAPVAPVAPVTTDAVAPVDAAAPAAPAAQPVPENTAMPESTFKTEPREEVPAAEPKKKGWMQKIKKIMGKEEAAAPAAVAPAQPAPVIAQDSGNVVVVLPPEGEIEVVDTAPVAASGDAKPATTIETTSESLGDRFAAMEKSSADAAKEGVAVSRDVSSKFGEMPKEAVPAAQTPKLEVPVAQPAAPQQMELDLKAPATPAAPAPSSMVEDMKAQAATGAPQPLVPQALATAPAAEPAVAAPVQDVAALPTQPAPVTAEAGGAPNVLASILFTAEQADIPSGEETKLKAIADKMAQDGLLRINIISYASSADGQTSTARRVSLKRALSVRKYFIAAGLDGTRINVQAMGSSGEGPKDRVDILLLGNS